MPDKTEMPRVEYCTSPDMNLRAPAVPMGALSCDCHAHICGPESRYAYSDDRIYTPPDALLPDYLKQLEILGIERSVLVQPSIYGADNTVLLRAMRQMTASGFACRGIAVVDDSVSDRELDDLHQAGVRGLRFNLVDVADASNNASLLQILPLCERIARLGWHSEFLLHADDYPEFLTSFGEFPTDIVLGHTGYLRLGQTGDNPGFKGMLELAAAGKCWVKLTAPYRISASGELPFAEAGEFARAVVGAAPARVVWGSDWPHVNISTPMPNDADLCDLFLDWVPDAQTRRQILVDNPAILYEF
jgi:2-pyrone-4,6-dicarboxylate lactonase